MLKHFVVLIVLCVIASHTFTLSEELLTTSTEAVQSNNSSEAKSCILKSGSFQNRSYYFEPSIKRTRNDADLFCKAIGMELVSVETCEENSFIADFIKDIDCTRESFWTSGILNDDKKWIWGSTNKEITYFNWRVNEPNYLPSDTSIFCIEYRWDYLQWNDHPCTVQRFFICESNKDC